MKPAFNPHGQALKELLAHLDKSDDEEFGAELKPKEAAVEVTQVEATPEANPGEPKLSDEQVAELIEALEAKLG